MSQRFEVYAAIEGTLNYYEDSERSHCVRNGVLYKTPPEVSVAEYLNRLMIIEADLVNSITNRKYALAFQIIAAQCFLCFQGHGCSYRIVDTGDTGPIQPINSTLLRQMIDSERDYQDLMWADSVALTESGSIILFSTYLQEAKKAWTHNIGDDMAIIHLRKLAGIAVRALEINGISPVEPFTP